jgi:hypothetical protein
MVTLFGTFTAATLLVSLMTHPPAGAGPFRFADPVEDSPPGTDGCASVIEMNASGTLLIVVVLVVEPNVALIVIDWADVTGVDDMLNVAVVWPPANVTLGGTVMIGELLARVTVSPALGAGPEIVTVPTEFAPPATVDGFALTERRLAGTTVRLAV